MARVFGPGLHNGAVTLRFRGLASSRSRLGLLALGAALAISGPAPSAASSAADRIERSISMAAAPSPSAIPKLVVTPGRGANGWTLEAVASGFPPDERVRVFWSCDDPACVGERPVATASIGSDGTTEPMPVLVPDDAPIGLHDVTAIGETATAVFTFNLERWLTITPRRGLPGWNATLVGTGFAPGESVDVTWDCSEPECQEGKPLGTTRANQLGRFELTVPMPFDVDYGDHPVGALGQQSGWFTWSPYEVSARGGDVDPFDRFLGLLPIVMAVIAALVLAAIATTVVVLRRRRDEGGLG